MEAVLYNLAINVEERDQESVALQLEKEFTAGAFWFD